MKDEILLACEESQIVTKALRSAGVKAYSCDLQDCSGGHPEWHYKQDVRQLLQKEWGGVIAFPPCTHLAVSGARHFKKKREDGRQQAAIDFFMIFTRLNCEKFAIENPVGIMSSLYRKPDQIIQPYYFGDNIPKKTCLWLKGLPRLQYYPKHGLFKSAQVEPEYLVYNSKKNKFGKSRYSIFGRSGSGKGKERSVFFPRTAAAIAEQWGPLFLAS